MPNLKKKKRKSAAMSAFGLEGMAVYYETAPLYQREFQEGDMMWLADEYRRRSRSETSLTLEDFSIQYGVPVDKLRDYIPELNDEFSRSVVLYHGTSKSRAESILKEGFKVQRNAIFFTKKNSVARGYAQGRARQENDDPAVITCSIDLNRYSEYERRGGAVFVFNTDRMASEVVRNIAGVKRQRREKYQKRENLSNEPTNVILTFNAGRTGIAYWINSFLKLSGPDKIDEDHEAVEKIRQWLQSQSDDGRFGPVPDDEIKEQINKCLY